MVNISKENNTISLNIAGAFSKFGIIAGFPKLPLEIRVYDGILHEWCGGRIRKYQAKFDLNKLKFYCNRNIKVFITFSNHYIDTNDTYGNEILSILEDLNCGVILNNNDLWYHIKTKYPGIETIYSITGHSDSMDFSLENRYNLIVPRFEWIFDAEFLKYADTAKYEIMLNDTCIKNCQYWLEHFKAISERNILPQDNDCDIQECWIKKFDPNKTSKYEFMDLDAKAIRKALNLGYRHFKFSGRENNDAEFEAELYKYIEILKSASTR